MLVRDYHGQRHTVTVVSDGFDWQGATYPSLSAIARAITGTAWSGPRFFALAPANGAPARRNKNAIAREGRDGPQPARGMNAAEMNTASLPLQTASHGQPKTMGVGYASLLERLSQTGSGLLSDCAPCGVLGCRAHRVASQASSTVEQATLWR